MKKITVCLLVFIWLFNVAGLPVLAGGRIALTIDDLPW